jgi:hypothetical protein
MHDLELARLIHADRERAMEHDRRVRAFRRAQREDAEDAFVPPAEGRPRRITYALRLIPGPRRG